MRKKSRFEKSMLLELVEVRDNGITVFGNMHEAFNNIYGIAHGGYLYTIAHITAQMTGDLTFGGKWDVASAECFYMHAMEHYPVRVDTLWLNKNERQPVLRSVVRDRTGVLCFEMNVGLKPAQPDPTEAVTHTPAIFTDRSLPRDPDEEINFPCKTGSFSNWLDIYATSRRKNSLVYSVDLSEKNCDDFGYLHPAVLFTAADSAAGGTLFHMDKKRPITVSANVQYFDTTCMGPVHAVPRPVRTGRLLNFYNVDFVDGEGRCVGTSQFIMRDKDKQTR